MVTGALDRITECGTTTSFVNIVQYCHKKLFYIPIERKQQMKSSTRVRDIRRMICIHRENTKEERENCQLMIQRSYLFPPTNTNTVRDEMIDGRLLRQERARVRNKCIMYK